MSKYKIIFKGIGFTSHHGFNIRNYEEYNSFDEVPTFDEKKHEITEGLKRLEKSGKLDIVDSNTKPEGITFEKSEPNDPLKAEMSVNTKEDLKPSVEEETSTEETSTEETSTEETVETIEYDGEEIPLDHDIMDEKLYVADLDDICDEYGLEGYSDLNKHPKIDFIIEQLS